MSGLLSKHKNYEKFAAKWQRSRDAIEGGDAVRARTIGYLPQLTDQTPEEYRAYLQRPCFYDATARTAEALSGLVFAKPATVDVPDKLVDLLDDVDLAGKNLEEFCRYLVDETLATGRGFIVVNHNGNPLDPGTLAEPKGRPYLAFYNAESVLDWRVGKVDGRTELTYLKTRECVQLPGADEFTVVDAEQYRVFDLDPGGNYRQRVFRAETNGGRTTITLVDEARPLIDGKTWRFLPIVPITLTGSVEPGPVPLLPIADTNISHWRTQADLEHAAHFTGLPTPWVSGVRLPEGMKLRLGSSEVLVFDAPDAKAGFLQLDAASLTVLEKLSDRKEAHMAALGARMLAPEKAQNESGFALSIRSSGENGALARVAAAVSLAISKALQYCGMWSNLDEATYREISIKLNSQFIDSQIAGTEITALMAAWQSGAISHDTFLYNMQRGGRLPDGKSIEDEKDEIEASPPPLGTMNDNPDPNADPNADPAADPASDPQQDPPADPPADPPPSKAKGKAKSKGKAKAKAA